MHVSHTHVALYILFYFKKPELTFSLTQYLYWITGLVQIKTSTLKNKTKTLMI